ncbi:MAG TPA: polysaccharide pyruvyl transferase family protein [Gallionellaceae bacterium]|nr:polysaccharide pyruvyl transferase family protein [Gallionellaceae bacterium]
MRPTILFGAFDRHNFGDLLFPHITAALLKRNDLIFAGLAERDLRCFGGHRVQALAGLAADWGGRPANIIHVGGELLTCEAWQAAVMLQPPEEVQATIAYFDRRPEERLEWVHSRLGISALAPYTVPRGLFPRASSIIYNAVGGVNLSELEPAMRTEVLANLKTADAVSVRDRQTLAQLEAAGIPASLTPDPAVMVAALFEEEIRQRARKADMAQILAAFPQGYIALQFSADFGDDATLAEIAAQLDRVVASTGCGVVFFRAGAAPWHDDLDCYRRVAARMHSPHVRLFTSLNLWDICAVVARSRVYCGSSLHGRIVAMAFALPRISLIHPRQINRTTKQAAFAATWDEGGLHATVALNGIDHGIRHALSADPEQLQKTADKLAAQYRHGFESHIFPHTA